MSNFLPMILQQRDLWPEGEGSMSLAAVSIVRFFPLEITVCWRAKVKEALSWHDPASSILQIAKSCWCTLSCLSIVAPLTKIVRFLTCQWSTVLTLESKTRSYCTVTQPEYTYTVGKQAQEAASLGFAVSLTKMLLYFFLAFIWFV